jgi:hypothetical protein
MLFHSLWNKDHELERALFLMVLKSFGREQYQDIIPSPRLLREFIPRGSMDSAMS